MKSNRCIAFFLALILAFECLSLRAEESANAPVKSLSAANKLLEQKQYQPAIEMLLDLRSDYARQNATDNYIQSLGLLGLAYLMNGQRQLASLTFDAQVDVKSGKPQEQARLERLAGHFYEAFGAYEEGVAMNRRALALFDENLSLRESQPDDYVELVLALGRCLHRAGQFQEAERWYLRTLDKLKGDTSGQDVLAASNLATLYADDGRYDKAVPLLEQALKNANPRTVSYVVATLNLASLYKDLGRREQAEDKYNKVLQRTAELTAGAGQEQNMTVTVESSINGGQRESRTYVGPMSGLGAAASSGDPFSYNLGDDEFFSRIQREVLAKRQQRLAELKDLENQAKTLLAGAYFDWNKTEKFPWVHEVMRQNYDALKTKGLETPEFYLAGGNLGSILLGMGRTDEALTYFSEAIGVAKKLQHDNGAAFAWLLGQQASALARKGDYEKAEQTLRDALQITDSGGLKSNEVRLSNLEKLTRIYFTWGKWNQAIQTSDAALAEQQKEIDNIFSFTSEPQMLAYQRTTLPTLEVSINLANRATEFKQAATENAAKWVLRRKGQVLDVVNRNYMGERLLADSPETSEQVTRLRNLQHRLTNAQSRSGFGLDESEIAALKSNINSLESIVISKLPRSKTESMSLEAVQRKLPAGTAVLEFMRSRIYNPDGSTASERWRAAHYFVFVIRSSPQNSVQLFDLGLAEKLDGRIAQLCDAMYYAGQEYNRQPDQFKKNERAKEESFRIVSAQLYRELFKPLEPSLAGTNRLYICPEGELNRLPFEALYTGKGYLIDQYNTTYLTSGRDLLRDFKPPGKGTDIFADPDYDYSDPAVPAQGAAADRVPSLPGNPNPLALNPGRDPRSGLLLDASFMHWRRVEGTDGASAEQLKDTVYGPVRIYRRETATEAAFKHEESPRVLHVSTHGFFNTSASSLSADVTAPDPVPFEISTELRDIQSRSPLLDSGIVLAGANIEKQDPDAEDGIVYAQEISRMNLDGTELVVLGACKTGLGENKVGEGVYGLRWAFLNAGARTLVSSLYEVSGPESALLLQDFYKKVANSNGVNKSEALYQAKMSAKARDPHPFFWASFICIGNSN